MTKQAPDHMTPEELHTIRTRLKWTQPRLADVLGVHVNTVQNYEAGRHKIPKVTAKYLRSLIELHEQ